MSSDTSPPVTILLCQARSRTRAQTPTHIMTHTLSFARAEGEIPLTARVNAPDSHPLSLACFCFGPLRHDSSQTEGSASAPPADSRTGRVELAHGQ